jgi:PAS domain S-box-containing protein
VQVQFEEAIEKRTFELQVANGALNREIAERIQAEEETRDLQKQLNLILDSAGEGILGLDNHGKVIFINRAASLMLGWEVEELLGNTHHELIHHTHADGTVHPEETCPIYMAYRDGHVHYKTGDVFWCKNGTSFPVEYVSTPIRDRGMLSGAVVVFRDMNTYK